MAAAVATPWRAPGLAMAPGGHLDSGIFTIIFIFLTIMIMTMSMVRYGWGGQRECAKRDSLNGWGGTFEGAQKVRKPTMTLMIIVIIMAAGEWRNLRSQ